VLKPGFGGASLGSDFAFLPKGFTGSLSALAASLARHAGQVDTSLSTNEKRSDLIPTPATTSLIATIRHRFGDGIEAYFNALVLRDRTVDRDRVGEDTLALSGKSPLNPFRNAILVDVPSVSSESHDKESVAVNRFTTGIIASLPLGWRANAEATFGSLHYKAQYRDRYDDETIRVPDAALPDGSPFDIASILHAGLARHQEVVSIREEELNHYSEQSLRLAGPVFRSSAGPATLTILLQNRTEAIPPSTYDAVIDGDSDSDGNPRISTRTRSIYTELSAPLIRRDAAISLVRGLTLQLAIRHDWQRVSFDSYATGDAQPAHPHFSGTMYTAGAKIHPAPWLMLRGSYATGQQPPPLGTFDGAFYYSEYIAELIDPRRGGVQPFNDDQYPLFLGATDPKQIHASTLAFGAVINPEGTRWPRVSIDYSQTRRTGNFDDISPTQILANEDKLPGRVVRAPLTDADRAAGYTGGRILSIDATGLPLGHIEVKSIDVRVDWRTAFAGGVLRIYGGVTRQLSNRLSGPYQDRVEYDGFVDGPLKWRANGGADWICGRTTLGANIQYFGHYRIAGATLLAFADLAEDPQGSRYVKAQAYVDLHARRRFRTRWAGSDHQMSIDLGIINLFDHAPPFEQMNYAPSPQYSTYGDPRERRFEITLNASF